MNVVDKYVGLKAMQALSPNLISIRKIRNFQ